MQMPPQQLAEPQLQDVLEHQVDLQEEDEPQQEEEQQLEDEPQPQGAQLWEQQQVLI